MKSKRRSIELEQATVAVQPLAAPQQQQRREQRAAPAHQAAAETEGAKALLHRLQVLLGPAIVVLVLAAIWLPPVLSNAAATVNGENISRSELDSRVALERLWNEWSGQQLAANATEADRFRSSVLDSMIQSRLVMQAAKKASVTVSQQEVAAQVASFTGQLNLTDVQVADGLARAGLTRQALDSVMREDAIVDKYLRTMVVSGVAQAEQQTAIRNWYNTALSNANISKRVQSGGARIRQAAPDFTLKTLDGSSLRLADLQGKPGFINFFASWCKLCRAEMPDIEATWKAHEGEGLVVLTINLTNQDTVADVTRFVQQVGMTMPVLLDEKGAVATLYRVGPIPASYFIDK